MKAIAYDSSTIITLAINCLLPSITKLHELKVRNLITKSVLRESVYDALSTQSYSLQGIRVASLISNSIIEVIDDVEIYRETKEILSLSNKTFYYKGRNIKIIHEGEASIIALAKIKNVRLVAIDEKTTRLLIEDINTLHNILEGKLHRKIKFNRDKYIELYEKYLKNLKVIRSVDIIAYLVKEGYFNDIIGNVNKFLHHGKREFIRAFLYSLRNSGCSISEKEINEYKKILL